MITIAEKQVGPSFPCLMIAEVALSHDGSLGTAHAYIDAVAKAGADAVKFQTHIAEAESSDLETFRVRFSYQDKTRFDYWQRMEFSAEQWAGLADHARECGLIFLSSAFSEPAVRVLDHIGMPAWKVASGEIATKPMLRLMAETGKPVLLSTGMAPWEQIDESVGWLRQWGCPFALFQCTTSYPCPPEKWGLNVIETLRNRYECPVGFSDHSGSIAAGMAAAAYGTDLVEVHVVFSKDCFGPDVPASVTIDEFQVLSQGVRDIRKAIHHPVKKAEQADQLTDTLQLFSKSIFAAKDLDANVRLEPSDLTYKKPGVGIPAKEYESVIGSVLRHSVRKGELLKKEDLDG